MRFCTLYALQGSLADARAIGGDLQLMVTFPEGKTVTIKGLGGSVKTAVRTKRVAQIGKAS